MPKKKREFPHLGAGQIFRALEQTFCQPEWACFSEVGSSTGGARQYVDALLVNMWRSRGLELRGVEIKVSRSDLQRELKDPAKSDLVAGYCNSWWLAAPKGMVDVDELPLAWGLLEVDAAGKVFTKKQAAKRPTKKVKPLTIGFVAAIARAAAKRVEDVTKSHVPRSEIAAELEAKYQEGLARAPAGTRQRIEQLEKQVGAAQRVLDELGLGKLDSVEWDDSHFGGHEADHVIKALQLGRALIGKRTYSDTITRAVRSVENAQQVLMEIRGNLRELAPPEET